MSRHGLIPVWDEEAHENILVPIDQLDPELAHRLRLVPPVGGFVYAADEFLSLPLTPTPFYVGCGWLPKQGKAEIFAPPKSGKSFLCLQLARCIGAGEDFLGLPTRQGKVLYIQPEMAVETLQDRMRATQQEYPNVFVGSTFSIKLDKKQGQEDLLHAVEAVEPNVLILDSLYKMMAGDENETQDMEKIINFLDEYIIDPFECSVFITHHTGKDIRRGGRGSSVLESWVDAYIGMKKTSKKGEVLRAQIMPISMRHALPGEPFDVELVDGEFVLTAEGNKPKLIIEKVREWVADHDEFKASEIHIAHLGGRAPVQVELSGMVERGELKRFKQGWYRRMIIASRQCGSNHR